MLNSSTLYRTLIKPSTISPSLVAFYSLRRLDGYSGSAIRIRRSSDNAEQDIGFFNGVLDSVAFIDFAGSDNAYVTTWYEQTGFGNDLTISISTRQPQIGFLGAIKNSGGYPCIYFDGVDDRLVENNFVPPFQDFSTNGLYSVFSVFDTAATGSTHVYIHADRATPRFGQIGRISGAKAQMISFSTSGGVYTDNGVTSLSTNTRYVTSSIRRQNDIEIYTNGLTNGPTTTFGTPRNKSIYLEIGCRLFPSEAFQGNLIEFAIYNSDFDNTSRQSVENEIINYYGI